MSSRMKSVLRLCLLSLPCLGVLGCSDSGPTPMPANSVERGGEGYEWDNSSAEYTGYVEPTQDGTADDETAATGSPGYGNSYGDGAGNTSDPYANTSDPYGNTSDPYANTSDPYGNPDPNQGIGPPPENRDGYGSADGAAADAASGGYADAYADGYANPPAGGAAGSGMFATQIQPLLKQHCYSCHGGGPRASKGDLVLSSPQEIQSAGILKVSNPDDSELFIRITLPREDENRMPPRGPGLSPEEVALVRTWIEQGANFGGNQGVGPGDPYGGGYGDGYGGGYGGDYADAGAARDADGGYGDGYGDGGEDGNRVQAPPKNLAEAASRAFQQGDDLLAMHRLYAQALVSSDAAAPVLAKYQWVPAHKRPQLAVRWGIGIDYHAKGGFEGAPRPVGVNQNIPGLDDDDSGADEFDELVDFQDAALTYYAGEVGDELVIRLQNRIERGYYGEILREELELRLAGPRDNEEDFDGGYGGGISRSSGDGYGGGYGGGGSRDSDGDKPENRVAQIMPGVTMLGEHPPAELFTMAKQQGLDLLVILHIVVDRNFKARLVTNATKARLYDVESGDQLAVTGSLKNVDIQRELAKDPEDNRVIREMDKIFSAADETYKMRPFPQAAEPKHAIAFVKNLLADPSPHTLWKLSEVRFYQSRGLLKDEHANTAFKRIAPDHVAKLASGVDEEEIKTMFASELSSQLPETAPAAADEDEASEDGEPSRRRQRQFR